VKQKSTTKYCPNNFNNDEFENSDDEDEHYEKKTKKKSKKVNIDTIKEGVYCQKTFNEGHSMKECKLLMKLCQICKDNDHNMDQRPNKVVNESFPSRKIVRVHVIQAEISIVRKQK
jgi:hypothetical protein